MLDRIIVDVDAGGDDALSIFILLFAEILGLIKLEAITCARGNTDVDNVITNVYRILEAAERTDIPVYKGTNYSLITPEIQGDNFFGEDGFGDLTWDTIPNTNLLQDEVAAIAMGKYVINHPGEIYILGLAPLTNIALAAKLYPTFLSDVKGIYVMGGNHQAMGNIIPSSEFNFYMDPEAAEIILTEAKTLVHLLTWETAVKNSIDINWRFNELGQIKNKVMEVINRVDRAVFKDADNWLPSDAFATAALVFPKGIITKAESYPAAVELHGSITRGQVVIDHQNATAPNVVVIEEINKQFFMELLMEAATQTNYK